MPRLPPVEKSPHTRLRLTLWPGVGYSVLTFDQSHSSSSATIWARPVSVPCPISERAMRMTTVSSGRMTTQAVTSGDPSCARTTLAPSGIFRPSASPAPAMALPTTKERRLIFGVLVIMVSTPSGLGRSVNGLTDLLERAAATDVGDPRVDIVVGGLGLVLQERGHRHDHAGLTVAALGHLVVEPRLLHLVERRARGQALDGGDLLARDGGDRHHAGAHRDAVDVHRARAALGDSTAVLGAGEPGLFPDRPQQRRVGVDVDLERSAIDRQARHGFPPRGWLVIGSICDQAPGGKVSRGPGARVRLDSPPRLAR